MTSKSETFRQSQTERNQNHSAAVFGQETFKLIRLDENGPKCDPCRFTESNDFFKNSWIDQTWFFTLVNLGVKISTQLPDRSSGNFVIYKVLNYLQKNGRENIHIECGFLRLKTWTWINFFYSRLKILLAWINLLIQVKNLVSLDQFVHQLYKRLIISFRNDQRSSKTWQTEEMKESTRSRQFMISIQTASDR